METIWVAIISGCFSFVTFLLTRYFSKNDKQEDKNDEYNKRFEEHEEKENARIEQIEEEENSRFKSLEEQSAKREQQVNAINTQLSQLLKYQEQQHETLKIISNASRDTLRNNIIVIYNKYSELGYFPVHEREPLDHMTKSYYALGGNGVVPSLVQKLLELPTEPEQDEEEKE